MMFLRLSFVLLHMTNSPKVLMTNSKWWDLKFHHILRRHVIAEISVMLSVQQCSNAAEVYFSRRDFFLCIVIRLRSEDMILWERKGSFIVWNNSVHSWKLFCLTESTLVTTRVKKSNQISFLFWNQNTFQQNDRVFSVKNITDFLEFIAISFMEQREKLLNFKYFTIRAHRTFLSWFEAQHWSLNDSVITAKYVGLCLHRRHSPV